MERTSMLNICFTVTSQ